MTQRATEERIARFAARQHGLVTRAQLFEAGLGRGGLQRRLQSGRLRVAQRGVYRVGPLASPHEREMAAVLACGPDAALSHRSAAGWREILPPRGRSAPVEVSVRSRRRRRRPDVRAYSSPGLRDDEVETWRGIAVTTVTRTILDLAGVVRRSRLEQAVARAEREGLTSLEKLERMIERHPGRPGIGALRAVVEQEGGPRLGRSDPEMALLALLDRGGLPRPEANVHLLGYEVDMLWRAERLVVEVDGFRYHSSRRSFEADRRRDGHLWAEGHHVLRVTWKEITREPEATLVRIARALTAAKLALTRS